MVYDNGSGDSRRSVSGPSVREDVGSEAFGRDPGSREDEVLVGVSAGASSAEAVVSSELPPEAEVVHTNETLGYAAVRFPDAASAQAREQFTAAVTESADVEYAEENATVRALRSPDDPLYGDQYAPQQVSCETAWDTTLGDADVTIAVVDGGIQYDHSNLEANMDDSVSNHGRDFADDDGDPYPANEDEYHGTHVGGIAAGGTDDGVGHAGISDCSLLSARALGADGSGSLSDVADAIQWAADQGADVVNMSLGGGGYSDTMKNAVSYAWDQGTLLVASAGNDGPDEDTVKYPAAYEECIAVSALDESEAIAEFSSRGEAVELAAPGVGVVSTVTWDDYATLSGTSMASPVVAGVAGLVLSAAPDLGPEEVRTILRETAVDVGLADTEQGYGRVDAAAAVAAAPGTPEPGYPPTERYALPRRRLREIRVLLESG